MTAEPILFDGHYFSEIVLHTGNQGKCQDQPSLQVSYVCPS